ncbi:MAG: hypothetical protein KDA41_17955 [Planctomycetales bacterium]|nr:hypothetical protein [Planctomycetales bacterium]
MIERRRRTPTCRDRRGTSLVEVAVATLIVGAVLVGALSVVGASLKTRRAAADQNTAAHLAELLLAEAMSMPYEDPENPGGSRGTDSGEGGGNRKDFDDVDDYENFSESQIRDKDNKKIDGYDGWSRSSRVYWAERLTGANWLLYDTGLKKIIVTVTAPGGSTTQRCGMRHKWGSLEQTPDDDTTVVTMLSAELQVGDGAVMRAATNTFNFATDPNQ